MMETTFLAPLPKCTLGTKKRALELGRARPENERDSYPLLSSYHLSFEKSLLHIF